MNKKQRVYDEAMPYVDATLDSAEFPNFPAVYGAWAAYRAVNGSGADG